MATAYYGVNATKRDVNVPADLIGVGEVAGRVRIAYDEWVVPAAAITINSTLNLFKIPKGARVLDAFCIAPDQGTTGTGKLGWLVSSDAVEAANDAGLIASIDFKTSAGMTKGGSTSGFAAGMGKKFAAEVTAQLTITEAFDAGTGTIKFGCYYVLD